MKQTIYSFLLLILMNGGLFGKIEFCVSGIVECHGVRLEGIKMFVGSTDATLRNNPSIKTNKNGEFSFYVRPGNYEIILSRKNNNNFIPMKNNIEFFVRDKNVNLKVEMLKACKLKGIVRFENGLIPKGEVSIDSAINSASGKISENGSYFINGIRFGEKISVTYIFDSMFHKTEEISLLEGEEKELNLTLPFLNSIKGVVIDKTSREPIEECCVILQTKDTVKQLDFWTDKLGAFIFYNIPEGDYRLIFVKKKEYFIKEGYVPKIQSIHIAQNQSLEFFIEVE